MKTEFMLSRFLYAKSYESNNQIKIANLLTNNETIMDRDILDILRSRITFLDSFLVSKVGKEVFQNLQSSQVIVPCKWDTHFLSEVEIETSTVCNWKCQFCPTTTNLRYSRFMPMSLFESIIDKIAESQPNASVAIHFYNEPSLDPLFEKRVDLIKQYELRLNLYTNGTGLDENKLYFLRQSGILNSFVINIPSADRERFSILTGTNDYDKVMSVFDAALRLELPVKVSVRGKYEAGKFIKKMNLTKEYLAPFRTLDRSGILQNEYCDHINITALNLFGCVLIMERMYVDIDGYCFICCQDYHKKFKYAHISDGPISLIYGKKLSRFRKIVCGGEPADKNFICRKCRIMDDMRVNALFRLI